MPCATTPKVSVSRWAKPFAPSPALHCATLLLVSTLSACQGDTKVGIYHDPPAVAITAPPTGTSVFTGQPVNFEATVQTNSATNPTEVTHRWVTGSETMCEAEYFGADSIGTCTWSFENEGTALVEVTATDPRGDRATYQIEIFVQANTPPSIEMTGPEQDSNWSSADLIVFEAIVADAEEDTADLIVSAFSNVDGDITFAASPTSTGEWAGGTTLSAGTHLLTFTVEDSYGQSDQDTLTINVFDDGPPSISGATISPIPAYTDDDLIAVPEDWYDLSGSAERYRYVWYKDDGTGFAVDPAVTTDTYPNGKTLKHDLLYVEVTPYNSFGDGATETSAVAEVLNTPPDAPSVALVPSSPQPGETLRVSMVAGSYDADGDSVTYSYEWYVNGSLVGETTNVLQPSEFSHGDAIEVIVTPFDGEDEGTAATLSTGVYDTTAPDAPVVNTPDRYRNRDDWTLTGTCEPGATLNFSCADSITSWTFSTTCASDGSFSYNDTGLARGETASCSATATDSAGNTSGASNTVTTEVCNPQDVYEDDFGTGDSGADAIDRWTALPDDGRTTILIEGNILGSTDSADWYVISTTDDIGADRAAGIDYYNFEVKLTAGTSDYYFFVYKGSPDPLDMECSTSTGYTEYSDFVQDKGGFQHSIPSDARSCGNNLSTRNNCEDLSTDYYIEVRRSTSTTSSCAYYDLEITNGVW